ncbi:MAG: 3-hydroxyacyl-CoA dehydrogenase [Alphaproteobacteria bacterium]|nr:3-hydroxyacyl-CoA dehydrogenase [Alphaproteobacteria bacterium]
MISSDIGPGFVLAVLGAGNMGRGIAQVAAQNGLTVLLADSKPGAAEEGRGFAAKMLARAAEKGQISADEAAAAAGRIQVVDGFHDFARAQVVIEAIIENIGIKQQVFAELDGICGPDTVLATNTSSLLVAAVGAKCRHQARVGGMHFFNPVPLMALVEVIAGPRTAPQAVERLMNLGRRLGRTPVRVKDSPGFLVNHGGRAYTTEGLRLVQESVASFAEIDCIARDAGGFRMGPFELMDLTGMDVNFPASLSIYEQFFGDPRYRSTWVHRQMYESGALGRKTGRGFFAYGEGGKAEVPGEPALPTERPGRVWLWGHDDAASQRLAKLATVAGVTIDSSARPAPGVLALVAPLAEDATTTALKLGVDPRRTVAIDTIMGWTKLRTIMAPPAADATAVAQAAALATADGVKVIRINDCLGFVMPRIQAVITNLGAELCQQGIASGADVDLAMKLGFNYPVGPLEGGDRIGGAKILALLEGLHGFYGDDRYRPCPWLKRRALLGLPLATPERAR